MTTRDCLPPLPEFVSVFKNGVRIDGKYSILCYSDRGPKVVLVVSVEAPDRHSIPMMMHIFSVTLTASKCPFNTELGLL